MIWFKSVDGELVNSENGFSVVILKDPDDNRLFRVIAGSDNGKFLTLGSDMSLHEASLFIGHYAGQLKKAGEIVLEPKY